MDEYPLGTNAVVAVLAYTGYDMEDAMIVNKGSMERGLAHATLYKTEMVSVPTGSEEMFGRRGSEQRGGNRKAVAAAAAAEILAPDSAIDTDGAPRPGSIMEPGFALASVVHGATGRARLYKVKGADRAVVDRVSLMQAPGNRGRKETKMAVTLRFNRNPVIGDKFSSRHGQKGVLSFLWPEEDLPYVERTGIRPDILINPHAFPSRMTIGMLVESMASKAGALDGQFVDASPFQAARDGPDFCPPVEEHGEVLRRHGYNYCGSETMVSGFTGEQFEVDIYIGLVYYQRLRHMVSDKFQVRSLGPNNPLTQQPIKGRKAGGGIRFGEMERDSLLAHGAAYLLHDRLHACSDRHVASICSHCGSLLAPAATLRVAGGGPGGSEGGLGSGSPAVLGKVVCRVCNSGSGIERVALPFVFKYLASELAAMNIRIGLEIRDGR
jgi:DNA-directed RNA polymerase I subunit RPA2